MLDAWLLMARAASDDTDHRTIPPTPVQHQSAPWNT